MNCPNCGSEMQRVDGMWTCDPVSREDKRCGNSFTDAGLRQRQERDARPKPREVKS